MYVRKDLVAIRWRYLEAFAGAVYDRLRSGSTRGLVEVPVPIRWPRLEMLLGRVAAGSVRVGTRVGKVVFYATSRRRFVVCCASLVGIGTW